MWNLGRNFFMFKLHFRIELKLELAIYIYPLDFATYTP